MKQIITFLLLTMFGVVGVKAQTYIVTVGDQVTTAAGVEDNGLYGLYNPRNGKWMYEDSSHKLLLNGGLSFDGLNGSTTTNAVFRLISNGDGTYKIQAYDTGRYLPAPTGNGNISTSETAGNYALNIQSDGNMFPRCTNNGTTYGLDHTSAGVYAYTSLNMTNGSAQNYRLYKITLTEYVEPEGISIVTLNNTNTSRGALIYNPSASEKWVWSSGKSGTFNSSNANSQWVFYPTGDDGEYYLYNLGAQKFAVPTLSGGYNGYSWMFSHDAVAVTLNEQSDGTYKIFTANGSICMSVSNGYTGPIINYNDVGAQFAMTKLEEIGETLIQEIETAIGKLIHKTTPLTAAPTGDGWYAIRVKTHETYADQFVFTAEDEINYNGTYYPLDFYSAAKVRPAIDNSIYYAKLTKSAYGHYWQMPNGRYIQNSKPISGAGESSITGITYDATNGFTIKSSSYYFVPYLLGGVYFIGETGSAGKAYYDIYPISITDAGLTAWQVLCDDAPDTQEITCTRDDVKGLTSVYKNGYFFLPVDAATPTSDDFSMPGAINYIVNSTDKTVTIEYDPSLAIVAEGVEVHQGYGTTGLGNEKAVLLRMQVTPFNAMENAVMTFTLTNPDNISAVKVYETGNNVEFNAISNYTNTFDGTINSSTATVTLGSVAAGTHYYWLCATVADDATLGDVIDAALTSITYDYNGYMGTSCDLSAVGNPANSMKIFDVQSYPFAPTTYSSNVYRIPALANITVAGTNRIVAAADKRYNSSSDIGGGHVIDIVVRYSDDGGKTWSEPITIAKGDNSNNNTCGYGDPSLTVGANGKLYCLFAAGNTGFFYGLNRIVMCTSEDGATWEGPKVIAPASDSSTGITFTDKANLWDYFVTSGKGLCTSDGVLMYLLDAQTASGGTETNYLLYSTDNGATWYVDANVVATGANEAKLVELEPGKLLSSTRSAYSRIFNTCTYTKNSDGTCNFTWGTQRTESLLTQNGSGNNQDVIVYSRNDDGSAKALLHTITSGNGHKNLKLFMSIDQGSTWNEVMQVQPGGSRYAVTTVLSNDDLGILFEDYSLETGREYPINFLTVKKEQIEEWYDLLLEAAEDAANTVMIADGTNTHGPASYGDANTGTINNNPTLKNNWTSNETAGIAGLKLNAENNLFMEETAYSSFHCLGIKPSAGNATDVITITAPDGYLVKGFYMEAGYWTSGENYTLTTNDGTGVKEYTTSAAPSNGRTALNVTGIYKKSTTFSVQSLQSSNNRCLMVNKFYVILTKDYPVTLNVVGDASYATLYLPFDVTTDTDTKAYYVSAAADGVITLADLGGNIPANTAVVLINDAAAKEATFTLASGLTQAVGEEANLLKGTLTPMTLDLGENTPYYSMGRKKDNEGNYKIGFYKFNNNGTTTITLGANKAYLDTSAPSNDGKGFTFSFDNVDGIESIENPLPSIESTSIYNLSGQRVSRLTKGLYIVNGKKIVIK
ncbi:MAG: exo-alpha-sialidase [Prevotella sp.]|nr:exo-alpha-sialidase [Prevotella sp.]